MILLAAVGEVISFAAFIQPKGLWPHVLAHPGSNLQDKAALAVPLQESPSAAARTAAAQMLRPVLQGCTAGMAALR